MKKLCNLAITPNKQGYLNMDKKLRKIKAEGIIFFLNNAPHQNLVDPDCLEIGYAKLLATKLPGIRLLIHKREVGLAPTLVLPGAATE
jgi:hypothetical protein